MNTASVPATAQPCPPHFDTPEQFATNIVSALVYSGFVDFSLNGEGKDILRDTIHALADELMTMDASTYEDLGRYVERTRNEKLLD